MHFIISFVNWDPIYHCFKSFAERVRIPRREAKAPTAFERKDPWHKLPKFYCSIYVLFMTCLRNMQTCSYQRFVSYSEQNKTNEKCWIQIKGYLINSWIVTGAVHAFLNAYFSAFKWHIRSWNGYIWRTFAAFRTLKGRKLQQALSLECCLWFYLFVSRVLSIKRFLEHRTLYETVYCWLFKLWDAAESWKRSFLNNTKLSKKSIHNFVMEGTSISEAVK